MSIHFKQPIDPKQLNVAHLTPRLLCEIKTLNGRENFPLLLTLLLDYCVR